MMENMTDWRTEARNIYSNDFKLHVVGLASQPGANVAQIARETIIWSLNGYASGRKKAAYHAVSPQRWHPLHHRCHCLLRGYLTWTAVHDGKIAITRSQLAKLLDKLDWRHPKTVHLNSLTML